MLTDLQVVFLGGDARQLEMIRQFRELDASVHAIGFEHWQNPYSEVMQAAFTEEVLAVADVLILPVVGTDEDGRIESAFTARELRMEARHFAALKRGCKLFTGMAKPYLREQCARHDLTLVELLDLDEVAIYNSIPTAEGALMLAIQHTDHTLHGSSCMVLGMGRTGLTLARTLKGIGAEVSVGVRRSDQFARAWEMGLGPFYIGTLAERVARIDLLFNTIPTMIVTAQVIANIPHQAVIIDLASKPGGTDFRYAEKRGVKAILAPGLPGIVAPKTAGKIMARCVAEMIDKYALETGE